MANAQPTLAVSTRGSGSFLSSLTARVSKPTARSCASTFASGTISCTKTTNPRCPTRTPFPASCLDAREIDPDAQNYLGPAHRSAEAGKQKLSATSFRLREAVVSSDFSSESRVKPQLPSVVNIVPSRAWETGLGYMGVRFGWCIAWPKCA